MAHLYRFFHIFEFLPQRSVAPKFGARCTCSDGYRLGVVGYALGTGVRASISQHWGVLLEARLLDMTDGNTNFAYFNYVLNLGLVYTR